MKNQKSAFKPLKILVKLLQILQNMGKFSVCHEIKCKKCIILLQFSTSKPNYKGDPIDGFQPVHNDEIHFLDINNEGVIISSRPNKEAFDFWARLEEEAEKLSLEVQKPNRDEL